MLVINHVQEPSQQAKVLRGTRGGRSYYGKDGGRPSRPPTSGFRRVVQVGVNAAALPAHDVSGHVGFGGSKARW
jgi:hypothetical protein